MTRKNTKENPSLLHSTGNGVFQVAKLDERKEWSDLLYVMSILNAYKDICPFTYEKLLLLFREKESSLSYVS